jgi:RNA polymerase sigma-70 factor (ECF subfamily)
VVSDDADLIARSQRGDRAACDALVRKHMTAMMAFMLRKTLNRSEAEDLLHETYLKARRGLASYEHRSTFEAWLRTIATRAFLDRARWQGRHPVGSDEGVEALLAAASSDLPNPEDALAAREIRGCAERCISALTANERMAFEASVAGENLTQLAAGLRLADNTVRMRLREARKKAVPCLARCLGLEKEATT